MKLFVDSDTAYLVLPNAKSRIAEYYYLSLILLPNNKLTLNMPILVILKMLRYIISSGVEAETTSIFINAQITLPIRHILEYLSHPQLLTLIKSNNSITTGFINNNMYQKYSKL